MDHSDVGVRYSVSKQGGGVEGGGLRDRRELIVGNAARALDHPPPQVPPSRLSALDQFFTWLRFWARPAAGRADR